MEDARFLTRVTLRNFKSISVCDVEMRALMFLVGPNGAGKSNFLDALRFVTDALRTSLDHALRNRGGINEVRRRSGGHPNHFAVRLEFQLPDSTTGHYAFRIGAKPQGGYEVQTEECFVRRSATEESPHWFNVKAGAVKSSAAVAPVAVSDRLYLVAASGLPEFKPVYDGLSRMGFYNLNPNAMRDLQLPDPGDLLAPDGGNLASVVTRLVATEGATMTRIEEYLGLIVPGVERVEPKVIGPRETLEFRQKVAGQEHPWRFIAANMSDGTLRALGILVALFQSAHGSRARVPLVGIEEPEVALHPGAVGMLLDSLRQASERVQIVVTSHSPDLLDTPDVGADELLAVVAEAGVTRIGPVDEAARKVLRQHLYTPGELLRLNQLLPDPAASHPRQLALFDVA